ncbi:PIH1 domain-containing protein 1 [Caerostris darwini]|uniref:PIH1 domain-containing protein 1 n=1 Tax=Caerostris darwini TaxID=1538125 RepID=A0AAV4W2C2_9ARAC|nr:PIH1 domain-containing protein 1 [Caerostris darwini]
MFSNNKNSCTNDGETFIDVNSKKSIFDCIKEEDMSEHLYPEAENRINTKPGFCIKSRNEQGVKTFINVCRCDTVPKPDEKLLACRNKEAESPIRFPLGLGLPHQEKDKSGKDCICFDVILNSEFIDTLLKDDAALDYIVALCIDGIRDKYGILINKETCVKLTKSYHGDAIRRFIKNNDPFSLPSFLKGNTPQSSSAPLIQELESSSFEEDAVSTYIEPLAKADLQKPTKSQSPKKSSSSTADDLPLSHQSKSAIIKNLSEEGSVMTAVLYKHSSKDEFVLEVVLPYNFVDKNLSVYVSENRIVVLEKIRRYKIEAPLKHPVIKRKCRAQFNEGILKVFLPLTPSMDSAGKVH